MKKSKIRKNCLTSRYKIIETLPIDTAARSRQSQTLKKILQKSN